MQAKQKVARLLVGFEASAPVPANGPGALVHDGETVGRVTSVVATPQGSAGLAILERHDVRDGLVTWQGPDVRIDARIEERSFFVG